MTCLTLAHRSLVCISGEDAQSLLQDVISCDVDNLPDGIVRPGALLTPQGKIMFDFLVSRDGEGRFLFDMNTTQIAAFVQRMTMYRLRAKAQISALEDLSVQVVWDMDAQPGFLQDSRFVAGIPVYRVYGQALACDAPQADYDLLRIEAGVAEAEADYKLSDAFPHDVLMDLNGGVSFKKGCFVGQEVVSRMQHRATARRRVVSVRAHAPLPDTETPIMANGRAAGTLGTVVGDRGLALVRIDKIGAALDADQPILAGDVAVTITLPAWTKLVFPRAESTTEADGD